MKKLFLGLLVLGSISAMAAKKESCRIDQYVKAKGKWMIVEKSDRASMACLTKAYELAENIAEDDQLSIAFDSPELNILQVKGKLTMKAIKN